MASCAALAMAVTTLGYAASAAETDKAPPEGVNVSPLAKARASGKPVEVVENRTESSETYVNPSGTLTVTRHMTPVRVKQGGTWVPVDTALVSREGRVVPKAAPVGLELSDGGAGPMVRLNDDRHVLEMSWPGELPEPKLAGPVATYAEVLPGVDLQVTAEAEGFSQLLVVKDAKAAKNPKLKKVAFGLKANGLKVTGDDKQGLKAVDAKGRTAFSGPAPQMWDSAKGEKKKRAVMGTEVAEGRITVVPDQKLLSAPDTAYPVYVDPSFTVGMSNWTDVEQMYPNASGWNDRDETNISVGYWYYNNAPNGFRGFFQMDVPNLNATRVVTKATLTFSELGTSPECTTIPLELWHTGRISPATTWNNQPTWNTKIATYSCVGDKITQNVLAAVQAAAKSGSIVDFGVRTTDAVEKKQKGFGWRWVYPMTASLSVEYAYNGQCFMISEVDRKDPDGNAFTKEMNCESQATAVRSEPFNSSAQTGNLLAGPHGFVCWRSGDLNGAGNRIWYYIKGDTSTGWTSWQGWGYVPADKITGAGTEPYPGLPACGVHTTTPGIAAPQDFNSDGLSDVLALQPDGNLALYPGNGNGTLANKRMLWTDGRGTGYTNLFTGDFDADGMGDVGAFADTVIWWWRGDGNSGVEDTRRPLMDNRYKTQAYFNPGLHHPCRVAFAADFNGDGTTDIMAACGQGSEQGNYNDDSLWWWPGDGDGGVNKNNSNGIGWEYSYAARTQDTFSALDITGDGRMDVSTLFSPTVLQLKAGPSASSSTHGTGTPTNWPGSTFGTVSHVFAGDFNGDRKGDMAGVDSNGFLWWWPGNGNGSFGTPSKMNNATDWGTVKDLM
ncbi:FG-GAP-like repeat-containing protein [Streptomyces caelestis]|uniref:VCBS repeat-containing protein n=1 Tax=Streptomyces caelestis TaxID=36816 RepID=A0A7W9GY09_9ACTN|nr:FG-GAP-like repeat-containing protein [Streptomyces caelestis]MBB5792120.1 hypothetical protein [Streptomyces caelestis]